MVPAPPPPLPPARRARSSSRKLSGSAVDKKPGRPSAGLPGAGCGALRGRREGGRLGGGGGRDGEGGGLAGPASARGADRLRLGDRPRGSRDRDAARAQRRPFPGLPQSCHNKKGGGGGAGRAGAGGARGRGVWSCSCLFSAYSHGAGAARGRTGGGGGGRRLGSSPWRPGRAGDFVSERGGRRRPRASPPGSGDRGGAHNRWGGRTRRGPTGRRDPSFRSRRGPPANPAAPGASGPHAELALSRPAGSAASSCATGAERGRDTGSRRPRGPGGGTRRLPGRTGARGRRLLPELRRGTRAVRGGAQGDPGAATPRSAPRAHSHPPSWPRTPRGG